MNQKAGRPVEIVHPTISTLSKTSLKSFSDILFTNGVVVIPNIGKFELRITKQKRLYHNFSKKVIIIKSQRRIHFTPMGMLKTSCKSSNTLQ